MKMRFMLKLSYDHDNIFFSVSIWMVGPSIALYYATVPFLLYSFPRSFTLGEAVIVGQGTTLLLVDTAVQLLKLVNTCISTTSG